MGRTRVTFPIERQIKQNSLYSDVLHRIETKVVIQVVICNYITDWRKFLFG